MAVVLTGSRRIGTTNTIIRIAGVQVHHPQFLEWVGTPESARLLGRAPGEWMRSLTRVQTLDAARQIQRDLNVLEEYALSLHGAASDISQVIVGHHCFRSTAVNDTALVPRVRHASTHMVSGAHRMDLVDQGLISFTMAPSVPVALHAFHKSLVGDRLFSSWTCGL